MPRPRVTHPLIPNSVLHSTLFVSALSCHLFFYVFTFYVLITVLAPTSDSPLYIRTYYAIVGTTLVAWIVLYALAILLIMQGSGFFPSTQTPITQGTYIRTRLSTHSEEAYV